MTEKEWREREGKRVKERAYTKEQKKVVERAGRSSK